MATETTERQGYFTGWTVKTEGIIAPDERPTWGQSIFLGLQHVLAMFGATVLAPILMGFNPNTAIFFSGIGTIIFFFTGYKWIDILLPPVVTGAVVAVIGLNLASVAVGEASTSSFDMIMAIVTILAVAAIAVYAPGALRRLPVLLGGVIGYLIYLLLANGFGLGKAIDFSGVTSVAWVGLPNFSTPTFNGTAIGLDRK